MGEVAKSMDNPIETIQCFRKCQASPVSGRLTAGEIPPVPVWWIPTSSCSVAKFLEISKNYGMYPTADYKRVSDPHGFPMAALDRHWFK